MENFTKIIQFDEISELAVYPLGSTTGTIVSIVLENIDLNATDSTWQLVETTSAGASSGLTLGAVVTPNPAGTTSSSATTHYLPYIALLNQTVGTATSGSFRVIVTVK